MVRTVPVKEYHGLDLPPEFSPCHFDHKTPFASHPPLGGWQALSGPGNVHSAVEYSLIFVVDRHAKKVLLGYKRRGMGVNLYNGFGGKAEPGESMAECAARELEEESGLTATEEGLYYKGYLYSSRPISADLCDGSVVIRIHFFACVAWSGQPTGTEEMIPEWFEIPTVDSIAEEDHHRNLSLPLNRMWPEASFYLLPLLHNIMNDNRNEVMFARIDYCYLSSLAAPTNLSALDGLTLREKRSGTDCEDEDVAERLSGWWMSFAPIQALSMINH
ncbi:uncharacterized protein IL334_001484 [Kwoniella shivajii]|uniref:Nudix hydrolase domain-containing protein n=1 Tax=Kwoniella shivajii TaxID=564305 RepID=A0ABZ1CS10_9TREE|nr:hypothetical protein IL334_001484 [Kwoniella shivajii]